MIITNKNLVFLDNPKCGSSTMRQKYYGQLSKIFQGFKNITDVNSNYSNYNYVHCNLEAAIIYIESVMKKDPNDFKFITTIRDPYTRVLSGLNHRHTRDNCCADDLWDYVKPGFGFSNFNSNKFRTFNEYKISYLIKVENLHQDVKLISDKYDLGLKIPINTISNKKKYKIKFKFTDEIVEQINLLWDIDFIEGGYNKKTTDQLNKELHDKGLLIGG